MTIRVKPLSDLHLEFMPPEVRTRFVRELPNDCDVLLLAGDIDAQALSNVPIVDTDAEFQKRFPTGLRVMGNHEYYGASVYDYTEPSTGLHVKDGVRFLATTLWFPPPAAVLPYQRDPRAEMNDFRMIENFEPWVYEQNAIAVKFLRDNVRKGDVVMTHHLPSMRCVHPKYAGSSLNAFFVTDLTDLILEREPALWCFGHTHESVSMTIGATRMVANPYGYFGNEVNPNFDPSLIIEVGT